MNLQCIDYAYESAPICLRLRLIPSSLRLRSSPLFPPLPACQSPTSSPGCPLRPNHWLPLALAF
uniref:Uncharacterized protein n=1 Tax=Picea sitchensis TaxID=3332 RepID=A0A6B9XW45_PICSI|nr:hypothetical protein Q903MT_gene4229 [Picea sitchensis]